MPAGTILNDNPDNIRYKLSLRCAFILGPNGFDTEKTFARLKELYDVRSSIIHGSEKRPKIKDNGRQELIVYARKCIISFYILYPPIV